MTTQELLDFAIARNVVIYDDREQEGDFTLRLVAVMKYFSRRTYFTQMKRLLVTKGLTILLPNYFYMDGQTPVVGKEVEVGSSRILGVNCYTSDIDLTESYKAVGGYFPTIKSQIVVAELANGTSLLGCY